MKKYPRKPTLSSLILIGNWYPLPLVVLGLEPRLGNVLICALSLSCVFSPSQCPLELTQRQFHGLG